MSENGAQEPEPPVPDQEEKERPLDPGGTLRKARRRRDLSLRQVANELHLTMHYVGALEDNAFDKLPGDVFVRGYMRSYALLVEIDPELVLKQYRDYTTCRQARKEEAYKRYTQRRNDRNRPWIIISSVAFVALAVFLWYLNGRQPASVDPDSQTDPGGAANESGQPEGPATGAEVTAAPGPPEAAADAPSEDEIADETGSDSDRHRMDWSGEDTLEVEIGARSHVVIRETGDGASDATWQQGDQLEVSGTAPFELEISVADGAVVRFNGRDVPLRNRLRQDGSARLTIGL